MSNRSTVTVVKAALNEASAYVVACFLGFGLGVLLTALALTAHGGVNLFIEVVK